MGHEPSHLVWLERVTSGILLAVVLALGWIIVVSIEPTWLRLGSPAVEVAIVLTLLIAALLLVSVVALMHTRL